MRSSGVFRVSPVGGAGHDRTIWSELVARHFVMQDGRPSDVRETMPGVLDPGLRCLLFSSGVITQAVEAWALGRVAVRLVDQRPFATPAEAARSLSIAPGEKCVRRRVFISIDGPRGPSQRFAYAESYLNPQYVTAEFLRALSSAGGIGFALQETGVESRRELLWLGLRAAPVWVRCAGKRTHVVRAYRIIIGGQPSIYVLEGFPGATDVVPSP